MLTIVLTIIAGLTNVDAGLLPSPKARLVAAEVHGILREALAEKLQEMNAAEHGVFHDDVTSIVAPYFPTGQTLTATERMLAEQKLGSLRRFHGQGDSEDSTVYVSHTDLMSTTFVDVSVVIDFNFAGQTEQDMTLKKVRAHLQAPSM